MHKLMPFVTLMLMLPLAGCGKGTQSTRTQDLIIGRWSGSYHNPTDSSTDTNVSFEFEFTRDGIFRMGKRKVWVKGTYQFQDPLTFVLKVQGMPTGPYLIKELTSARLVYERTLPKNQVQRTELVRE